MKILGLSTMGNSSAAITIDGRVVAAIEEERLTRTKNDGGFPFEAIKICLDVAGMTLADIDEIAVYWKPWKIGRRGASVLMGLIKDPKSINVRLKRSAETLFGKSEKDDKYPELRGSWLALFNIKSMLKREFGNVNAKIRYFDHHDCHAASIYHITSFRNAICVSYDGGGESDSTVIYAIENGRLEKIKTIPWPNSLGHFYATFTGFLGFRMLEGEYKMMGLAPYGKPIFKEALLRKVIKLGSNGNYHVNAKVLGYHAALKGEFTRDLQDLIGPPRDPDDVFNQYHRNVAASVQAVHEEVLLHLLSWARNEKPGYDNLCIAGGCGLNVSANGKVIRRGLFDKVLIPPAPHDAGTAIGASFLAERKSGGAKNRLSMPTPYLGKSYRNDEILDAFNQLALPTPSFLEEEELLERISLALSQNKIVGWFQGASEFGPRALGNRSFLADPRDASICDALNTKIKKRELFRPFAPSCKIEVASEYFEIDQESPYMNVVATVKPEKRSVIPAVTHVDNTARVHTVAKSTNPLFWNLIDAFEKKTGVGVLLNTSFNIREPIVENPMQAIDCFLRSTVDLLAVGSYVCDIDWRKKAQGASDKK